MDALYQVQFSGVGGVNLSAGDGKTLFLERAAKNISNCPLCNKPYNPEDLIVLNQISKEKIQKMRDAMEDKRTRKQDQKMNEKRDKRLGEKLQLETENMIIQYKIFPSLTWLFHTKSFQESNFCT